MRSAVALLAALSTALDQSAGQPACHQGHPSAGYKMTPMPPPPLMTGIGVSFLKITTASSQAQAYFTQGFALLHCFWEFEAYRAFKEAARLDPDAPMPYWGILRSIREYPGMEEERQAALAQIKRLKHRASGHERYYLREFTEGHKTGEDASRWLKILVERYPEDLDAQALSGLSSDRPALERLLAKNPGFAAANHYWIHATEGGPHPEQALQAADALAKLAPASGHMVHMPGHIYYRVGDQERARASFLAAMKVDEDYMQSEQVGVPDNWNYSHNMSYLIASDVDAGRYQEALSFAAKLDELPVIAARAIANPRHATTVGATTARLQIRLGDWNAVLAHPVKIGDESAAGAPSRSFRDGMLAYARGMRAVTQKDFATAAREADSLDAIEATLRTGHLDPKEDGNPENVLNLLASYALDLRGNLACENGQFEAGMQLLEKSAENEKIKIRYTEPPTYARPEQESIGYAYLHHQQFDKALTAFEQELRDRPRNGHALYGIALAYGSLGNREVAGKKYSEFLAAWTNADPDLPMIRHAKSWLGR